MSQTIGYGCLFPTNHCQGGCRCSSHWFRPHRRRLRHPGCLQVRWVSNDVSSNNRLEPLTCQLVTSFGRRRPLTSLVSTRPVRTDRPSTLVPLPSPSSSPTLLSVPLRPLESGLSLSHLSPTVFPVVSLGF